MKRRQAVGGAERHRRPTRELHTYRNAYARTRGRRAAHWDANREERRALRVELFVRGVLLGPLGVILAIGGLALLWLVRFPGHYGLSTSFLLGALCAFFGALCGTNMRPWYRSPPWNIVIWTIVGLLTVIGVMLVFIELGRNGLLPEEWG